MSDEHRIAGGVDDAERIAETLADAFEADPFFRWMWSTDARGIRSGVRAWMSVVLGRLTGRAEVATAGDGSAAAVWIHPDRPLSGDDYAAVGDLLASRIGARATEVMGAIAATGPLRPEASHRVLLYVGVRPAAQGRGLGVRVLEPGLAAADAQGLPVYLTSTNERNLPFYRRLGFDVLGEVPIADGVVLRPMWRKPT
jgi:GNAT superfamily N-acetyltransferase